MGFDLAGWAALGGAALVAGISKTGMPGLGMLSTLLATLALPAKAATGFILPLLSAGDLGAVILLSRRARWPILRRLLPWTLLGIVAGALALGRVSDEAFRRILGGLILGLLALDLYRKAKGFSIPPGQPAAAAAAGILAGFCTMMANAAGPLMALYLLAMGLSKEDFIGTQAWFFLVVNLVKWPFSLGLGLIGPDSLLADLCLLPALLAGELVGLYLFRKLPQKAFDAAARALAALGGLRLLL